MSKKNETPLQALSKKEKKAKAIADGPQKRFLGQLNSESETDKRKNAAMLKAYLRGDAIFKFGFQDVKTEFGSVIRQPQYHMVAMQDKTVNAEDTQKLMSGGFTNRGCQFVRNTPGVKRTSHAEIRDRQFQREEDNREKEVEEFNKEVKKFNKGKKKAEKMEFRSFTRKPHRPGSKADKLASEL